MLISIAACRNRNVSPGPVYTNQPPVKTDTEYVIQIQGVLNVAAMMEVFLPMANYLEEEMQGTRFRVLPITDFGQFQKISLKQQPAIIIANPYEAVLAMEAGYDVVASVGQQQFSKACLVVPAESSISLLQDLQGKTIAFPPVNSFTGTLVPELTLFLHNKQLYKSVKKTYLSTIESPLFLLLDQKAHAAFVPQFSWFRFQKNYPLQAQRLKVVYETDSLAAPAVLINKGIKEADRVRIRKALFRFNDAAGGRHLQQLFGSTPFFPADQADYENVKERIRFFESEIRPVYKLN
ncbi:MAG: phosphate/phosphite/phosphonate ABC transporter substrate-binding protein [Lacibacter sp.]|jgi:phosphonate transport system substrate-binding protein